MLSYLGVLYNSRFCICEMCKQDLLLESKVTHFRVTEVYNLTLILYCYYTIAKMMFTWCIKVATTSQCIVILIQILSISREAVLRNLERLDEAYF